MLVVPSDPSSKQVRNEMPLNPDAVGSRGEPVEVSWNSRDTLLYAVGIGAGTDELAFTTENTSGVDQVVFPTFPVVLGWGQGSPLGTIGTFNPALLVHGQQSVTLHRAIPVDGSATLQSEVTAMYDKGKAAVVVTATNALMDGAPLYTMTSSLFIRGAAGGVVTAARRDPSMCRPIERQITR